MAEKFTIDGDDDYPAIVDSGVDIDSVQSSEPQLCLDPLVCYRGVEIMRQEHVVLKDANLSVCPGELVYLIGRVGSGKSSLIKTMYADVPVLEGEATVMGYDLRHLRRRDVPMLRRSIGIVFQDFQLLTDRTVYANLRFVLEATGWRNRSDIDERIEEVLSRLGMATKSYKMPHELSGGEQQRIAIARALLNSPRLILADEPTGNLDPDTGDRIATYLSEIAASGVAVVMATHNLSLIDRFPGRVVRCEDKRLVL